MKTEDSLKAYLHTKTGLPIYSQTPSNVSMKYPCIRVKVEPPTLRSANNNNLYFRYNRYTLTHIYKSPNGSLVDELLADRSLLTSWNNRSVFDGLYNDSYEVYW